MSEVGPLLVDRQARVLHQSQRLTNEPLRQINDVDFIRTRGS